MGWTLMVCQLYVKGRNGTKRTFYYTQVAGPRHVFGIPTAVYLVKACRVLEICAVDC